ncbi:MAG: hypothetical protein ABIC68_05385 [Candidatus Omnitrophota bacterium]
MPSVAPKKLKNGSAFKLKRKPIINIASIPAAAKQPVAVAQPTESNTFESYYASLSIAVKNALGPVVSNTPKATADGLGSYKIFRYGVVLMHSSYGNFAVYGEIYLKWKFMKMDVGALGCPVEDQSVASGKPCMVFERGIIFGGKIPYEVHGWIYERYCQLGREKSVLGFPKSDERDAGAKGGRFNEFDNGAIYWTAETGAFEVHGSIRKKWQALGGVKSFLGFPLSDECQVGKTTGRFNRFEGGCVYWHPTTGAYEVHGLIRAKWEELGGVTSWLGYPTSDELDSPGKKVKYNNFQNGIIVFSGVRGAVAIKELHFYLDRFGSKGSDRWGCGGGQDVYVSADVTASGNLRYKTRIPKKGDFGSGKEMDITLLKLAKVNSASWINAYFKGMDDDDWNADDHLGTVERKYTIDDFWGIFDDPNHWKSDFQVVYSIKPIVPYDHSIEKFRNQQWWPFNNFSTSSLSKMQYAQTFRDVDPEEKWWLHPFNALYFEAAFEGIAAGGNCLGMCLESIYARVGRSVYAEPIYQWGPKGGEPVKPKDSAIINEINIKHGYQLGASCIDWAIGQFISGHTHDPKHVFYKAREEYNRGNYPFLVVTPSYFKLGAHAVLPYKFEEVKDAKGKIYKLRMYIADPNVEWTHSRGKYAGTNNINPHPTFIDINTADNTFRYAHGTNDYWTGGAWSGGRLYYIPFSKVSSQPRTPFWEIFALLVSGAILIIGGDADSEQISDGVGKTFYKKGLTRTPEKYEDINPDVQSRVSNMTRIALADFKGQMPEVYFRKGMKGGNLIHDMKGNKNGSYKYMIKTPMVTTYAHIPVAKGGADTVLNERISQAHQSMRIQTKEASKKVTMGTQVYLKAQKDYRVMELKDMPIARDLPVTVQMNEAKDALLVDNKGADVKVTLKVETRINGVEKTRLIPNVPLRRGKVLKVTPSNWSSVAAGKAKFEVCDRLNGPATQAFHL